MPERDDPGSPGLPNPPSAAGVRIGMDREFERPDWTPLERLIGDGCCQFMWMWRQDVIEFYKHINTRRYLLLSQQSEKILFQQSNGPPLRGGYANQKLCGIARRRFNNLRAHLASFWRVESSCRVSAYWPDETTGDADAEQE